ncbi:uncharacterized protein LOC134817908 [Bolinopsis microptera]|uniref:uncharacterized protein LOC134817908 n=1 Tax=Bolinopsis microptera TaxID=2820187 RepID=UPI003078D7DF
MFITVRSGASEERLFNLNCQLDALLRDITNRCPFQVEQDDYTLDLMDEEGRALSIYSRKGSVMGSECLTERGCYLLVLVKTDPKGRKYYEPLIQNLEKLYPDLKDVFGIEALDGSRKQAAKTRGKKGRLDRGLSDNGNSGDNPPIGAAVKAYLD